MEIPHGRARHAGGHLGHAWGSVRGDGRTPAQGAGNGNSVEDCLTATPRTEAVGNARLTLVLGGARSGKSRHAQPRAMTTPPPWIYVATAEALDDEMRERIAKHLLSRGDGWSTIEEPIELASAMSNVSASTPVVVDCMTLWLS